MEIEQGIEKVLRKHNLAGSWDWLISDLASLMKRQEPSREDLDALLDSFGDIPTPAAPPSYLEHQEQKRQAIMRWSRGESKKVCKTCKQEIR